MSNEKEMRRMARHLSQGLRLVRAEAFARIHRTASHGSGSAKGIPVVSGRAQGSVALSVGSPSTESPPPENSSYKVRTMRELRAFAKQSPPTEDLFMTWTVPYAHLLNRPGYSDQAPDGYLTPAIETERGPVERIETDMVGGRVVLRNGDATG